MFYREGSNDTPDVSGKEVLVIYFPKAVPVIKRET